MSDTKKNRNTDKTEKIIPRKPRYVPHEGHATVLRTLATVARKARVAAKREHRNAVRPPMSEVTSLPLQNTFARISWEWKWKANPDPSSQKSWHSQGAYIARSHEWLGQKPPAAEIFDAAGPVDRDAVAERMDAWHKSGDSRRWVFLISPDNPRCDFGELVPAVIARVERDLQVRLEWVAAVHDNTEHPHVHVAIRGRNLNTGKAFNIPLEYICRGFNLAVRKELTAQLGYDLREDLKASISVLREDLEVGLTKARQIRHA